MATGIDPYGQEPAALSNAANLTGARVLEVGCGDGRLAFRYGDVCRFVVGIEVAEQAVVVAAAARSPLKRERFKFLRASGVTLPFRDASFEIALFAWSL